jgi:rRNA maturation endonuclease Nob1
MTDKTICFWTQQGGDGGTYDDTWEASCDNLFVFNDGTPEQNDFKFCPYCGGKLEQVVSIFEGDDDD